MANGKVFINPKTGYLSNREKDLPPPPSRGPALTVRNPTHGSNSGSSNTPSPTLDKGKGKAIAHSISASSSRSNYSHLSYLSVGSVSSSKAKVKAKPFAATASSSKPGVGGSSTAGPSMSKAPVRAALPSKPGASAPLPSYDAGKIKASNPSPCYLTGIGRPKALRTLPGPARVGPASGADFRTPAGAPQIGLTWMLTNKGSPTANRRPLQRPLPLIPPRRVPIARAQRSFPATTPSSDRSSRACSRTPDPAKSSISSFWLSGSSPSASTASVGRTSSFFSIPTITVEDDLGTVDDDKEMLEYGRYLYEQGLEEDDGERTLTVRNYNEGDLRARHWRTSTFASTRLTTCSPTDTTHSDHSTSSTASSRPSSLRVRAMRARTLDKLEGRAPGAPNPNPNPVAGPIFMPAPTPTPTSSPPPGPSKFKQFLDRQKVNLRTAKNKVKWKLQGRTVVRPVARDGPSNFDID
ncbi:hypothetical protein BGZ75_002817 [Mortierella antarctica]|nr:hypothetical protein BGZ75_002817 [Mortierella antarctica]